MPLTFIILAIVGVTVLYFINTQRTLIALDERLKNALSQIGVQQASRWDAIGTLAKLVEKYSKHEHDTLMNVIATRRNEPIATANEAQKQQNAFGQVLGHINALVEQYPELKASELFDNTMDQLNQFENNVRVSRQIYNDTATRLNTVIRQWPSSFVANMLGFKQCEYLQTETSKTDIPNV